MSTPIVTPRINTEPQCSIQLPQAETLFKSRSNRCSDLSTRHPNLREFLAQAARIADCQHRLALGSDSMAQASIHGSAPAGLADYLSHKDFPDRVETFNQYLARESEPLRSLSLRLEKYSANERVAMAQRLIDVDLEQVDIEAAVVVYAVLQVVSSQLANQFAATEIAPSNPESLCPICNFLPVASVLKTGGSVQGLRYLVCGLCASEWNRPRIHCVNCGSSKDVAYFGIEELGDAVKAEACAACMTYIKLMNREKDSRLDPFADDIATLALDLLMAEEGYQRLGFNPLLIPGS